MNQDIKKKQSDMELTRRGFPIYRENPSMTGELPIKIKPTPTKKLESAYMVAPGTGEVIAEGAFAFIEEKEVDSEQFVKVYLEGIKQYGNLTKSGALLFEFIYRALSNRKDQDQVTINYLLVTDWKPDMSRSTFFRGMKELLEKGFLFRSISSDNYFVNIRFMFNGNRMVLVKSFRKNHQKKLTDSQV